MLEYTFHYWKHKSQVALAQHPVLPTSCVKSDMQHVWLKCAADLCVDVMEKCACLKRYLLEFREFQHASRHITAGVLRLLTDSVDGTVYFQTVHNLVEHAPRKSTRWWNSCTQTTQMACVQPQGTPDLLQHTGNKINSANISWLERRDTRPQNPSVHEKDLAKYTDELPSCQNFSVLRGMERTVARSSIRSTSTTSSMVIEGTLAELRTHEL